MLVQKEELTAPSPSPSRPAEEGIVAAVFTLWQNAQDQLQNEQAKMQAKEAQLAALRRKLVEEGKAKARLKFLLTVNTQHQDQIKTSASMLREQMDDSRQAAQAEMQVQLHASASMVRAAHEQIRVLEAMQVEEAKQAANKDQQEKAKMQTLQRKLEEEGKAKAQLKRGAAEATEAAAREKATLKDQLRIANAAKEAAAQQAQESLSAVEGWKNEVHEQEAQIRHLQQYVRDDAPGSFMPSQPGPFASLAPQVSLHANIPVSIYISMYVFVCVPVMPVYTGAGS